MKSVETLGKPETEAAAGDGQIELRGVEKQFGSEAIALRKLSLTIRNKELLVLVGPSGCGKTTTLNILAGLERPTAGEVYFGGRLMNDVPPEERDIGIVFQSIALYPHMNVLENIVFALKLRKTPEEVIRERVSSITSMLGIQQYLKRNLHELSGGERQRVAIAKALVKRPQLFLLDEPFSNLDADMRRQMRAELVRIHRQLETTMVFVTHDQEEAMSVADRIAVMNKGELVQLGAPLDVYYRPANVWVSRFIGTHPINLVDISLDSAAAQGQLFGPSGPIVRVEPFTYERICKATSERRLIVGIRPEFLSLSRIGEVDGWGLRGEVFTRQVLGDSILYELRAGENQLLCLSSSVGEQFAPGDAVNIEFNWPRAN